MGRKRPTECFRYEGRRICVRKGPHYWEAYWQVNDGTRLFHDRFPVGTAKTRSEVIRRAKRFIHTYNSKRN